MLRGPSWLGLCPHTPCSQAGSALGQHWSNLAIKTNKKKKPQHPAGGCSEQMGRGLLPRCSISITPNGCGVAAAELQLRQRCPQRGPGRPRCCDPEGCDACRPAASITGMGNNLRPCRQGDFTRACPSARGAPGSGCEHLASRADQRHCSKGWGGVGEKFQGWQSDFFYGKCLACGRYRKFGGKVTRRKVETRVEM